MQRVVRRRFRIHDNLVLVKVRRFAATDLSKRMGDARNGRRRVMDSSAVPIAALIGRVEDGARVRVLRARVAVALPQRGCPPVLGFHRRRRARPSRLGERGRGSVVRALHDMTLVVDRWYRRGFTALPALERISEGSEGRFLRKGRRRRRSGRNRGLR